MFGRRDGIGPERMRKGRRSAFIAKGGVGVVVGVVVGSEEKINGVLFIF